MNSSTYIPPTHIHPRGGLTWLDERSRASRNSLRDEDEFSPKRNRIRCFTLTHSASIVRCLGVKCLVSGVGEILIYRSWWWADDKHCHCCDESNGEGGGSVERVEAGGFVTERFSSRAAIVVDRSLARGFRSIRDLRVLVEVNPMRRNFRKKKVCSQRESSQCRDLAGGRCMVATVYRQYSCIGFPEKGCESVAAT